MVYFYRVASLLFFSYIAAVAANSIPCKQMSDAVALLGRLQFCPSPDQSESYDIQLKQLAYSLSGQLCALVSRCAATKVWFVATTKRVDVRACIQ